MTIRVVDHGDQTREVHRWTYNWGRDIGHPTQHELHQLLGEHGIGLRAVTAQEATDRDFPVLDSLTGMLHPSVYRSGRVAWLNHRGALGRSLLADVLARAGMNFIWNATADLAMTHQFMRHELAQRCTVVPLPVRTDIFKPLAHERPGPQHVSADDPYRGRPVVVYMGRLDTEKRIDHLVRFTRMVADEIADVLVVATGWFSTSREGLHEAAMIHGLVRQLGLRSHLRFVGLIREREAVAQLFRRASVSVNFTVNHDEAYGLAQIESAAAGTPTVGAAWGGLKDTIHAESGYQAATLVTDHGTFVDLHGAARAVADLLRSPDILQEKSRLAAQWGAQFTWSRYISSVQEMLAAPDQSQGQRLTAREFRSQIDAMVMAEYFASVMSPELEERWRPQRNPTLDQITVDQYCALRNQRHLDAATVSSLRLFDDLEQFRQNNYQFLMQHYGSTTAPGVIESLAPRSHLRPVSFNVTVTPSGLRATDLYFGTRELAVDQFGLDVWKRIESNPNTTPGQLGDELRVAPHAVISSVARLVDFGLVTAVA